VANSVALPPLPEIEVPVIGGGEESSVDLQLDAMLQDENFCGALGAPRARLVCCAQPQSGRGGGYRQPPRAEHTPLIPRTSTETAT
jgi:hypothetical protein